MNISRLFLVIFFTACLALNCLGQSLQPRQIRLKNITISLTPNAFEWASQNTTDTPQYVLLNFSEKPSVQQQILLRDNNVFLEDYIAPNTYTALISRQIPLTILSQTLLYSIITIQPEWKYESVVEKLVHEAGTGFVEFAIITNKALDKELVAKFIKINGGSILTGSLPAFNMYKIAIPAPRFKQFVAWYGISYISPLTENVPLNIEAKAATRANLVAASIPVGLGLTGEGVTIGVGDNTSGQFHVDLKDRIINYNPVGYTNHGVHINGIVGGAGIVDPKGEGHAPHATLVDHLYSSVWEQTPAMVQAHNMTITNNSYASVVGDCKYAGTYDVNSRTLDMMSSQYDEVLHVFAAGNDGYLDCSPYPAGFATVNGGYQPAKNNIVVTSTDKRYINAKDGGRGPIKDGRLKPEIAAVGVDVNSTTRNEGYLVAGGTSMACPEVAGALGLLTERYRQLKGSINPKAVLLKALILNGTSDIGNPGPDYRFGFGFMDVARSVGMINSNAYMTNTVEENGEQTFTINVPAGTAYAQLKVMLCWHDIEGSLLATTQLVNDLDLEVTEPGAAIHKPLILDPAPANINKNAQEGVDRLNNAEQVIIYNPQPGTYTVKVAGHSVADKQFYAVAYDIVPDVLNISFPHPTAVVKAADSMRVYWSVPDNINNPLQTFELDFSTDGGQNWVNVGSGIGADKRMHTWFVPEGINSGNCRMRIKRNNTAYEYTTGSFVVNTQPVAQLDTIQCPGYIRFSWDAIPNASGYKVFRKSGSYIQEMGATNNTSYTFSGLSTDSTYYVAVCPVIDGLNGYRSIAIKRMPNDGDCEGDISDGDMAIKIVSRLTGRKFTSTELLANEPLNVEVQNLDDNPVNHYRISYSLNKAGWNTKVYNTPIPPRGTMIYKLADIDMSVGIPCHIHVAVENLLIPDPVTGNDSMERVMRQLQNNPIDISNGFLDDFETMPIVNALDDSMGISANEHWDYKNSDTGHLRSYVNPSITIGGNRSISMDAFKNLTLGGNQNELIGTFNFSNYKSGDDEIRMEFDYMLHGSPKFKDGNEVWIRGNDTAAWQSIYTYETGYANVGKVKNSGTLSITDGLQKILQDYSSSFQVNFGQHDSSLIAAPDYGNGVTFDNVRFYTVKNDVQLKAIVSPVSTECGITSDKPIVISIRNGVNQALNNVELYYQVDNGNIVKEILPEITGKKQMEYTFLQKANLSAYGSHTLSVWLNAAGDTYRNNDSLLNVTIHNQPLITTFPYLEDFENNNGYWYTEGINKSWEYGVPAAVKINKAVSGSKVWATNLSGNYNNNENSYLYSPCFDISKLQNPLLRFKMAMDIENCGMVMCDIAFMEYSFDGEEWERLGAPRQGINWYNDSAYIWTEQDKTEWREAITALPKGNILRLRYAFVSDPGATFEGLALDDIEVLDQEYYTRNEVIKIYPNPTSDGNIHIEWTAAGKPEMEIAITDVSGKLVYTSMVKGVNGYNKSHVVTPHFYAGVYFMRIRIGEGRTEYKMVYL